LDQGPDNRLPRLPIALLQPGLQPLGEGLQMTDHGPQLRRARLLLGRAPRVGLERLQARPRRGHPLPERLPLQEALLVHLRQPGDPPLDPRDLLADRLPILRPGAARPRQPPAVFRLDPPGLREQPADILPDRGIEPVDPHHAIVAHALTTESIRVGAGAAIVPVAAPPPRSRAAPDPFAVVGAAASRADQQPLQQVPPRDGGPAMMLAVAGQSLLDGGEGLLIHQRRHGDRGPLLGAGVPAAVIAARELGLPAAGPQAGPALDAAGLAVFGRPLVGGVPEHVPQRGAVPGRLAGAGGDAPRLEPPGDGPQRAPLAPDPVEDLAGDARLLQDDLVGRAAAALGLGDITISIRGASQDAQGAAPRRVPPAAAGALED